MYRINGHPATGGTKTRGLAKYVLICSNAFGIDNPIEIFFPYKENAEVDALYLPIVTQIFE